MHQPVLLHLPRAIILCAPLALALAIALPSPLQAFEVPGLTGPVVDKAGLLTAATERQIAEALVKIRASKDGAHIAVLTVPDLEGVTIEQAGIQVVDKWQLGTADRDNGVLLLVARQERQIRIEVGQGLEGDLPDAIAKRIIAESMTPLFASGNFDEGILVGVFQIATRANPQLDVRPLFAAEGGRWQRSQGEGLGLLSLLPILIIVLLFIFGGRGMRGGLLTGMILGGLMGGRGGGGGGGFGGRGGGFSGGGASGGW